MKGNLLERADRTADGCWVWRGGTAGAGYGVAYVNGRHSYVHRLAYEEAIGPIPRDREIDHLCRNRLCFNPDHLEAITHAENRRRARLTHCVRGHLWPRGECVQDMGGPAGNATPFVPQHGDRE